MSGVLSLSLDELAGLPPRASGGSAVQVIATLLQGGRREQRTSAPLAYAECASWSDDEVLEFGGVLRSARLFLDVYAHHGVALPSDGSTMDSIAPEPKSTTLLGKVAICIDELPSETQLSATRALLVGSMRFRLAYTCARGAASPPVGVHAPAVQLRLSAPAALGRSPATPGASADSAAEGADEGVQPLPQIGQKRRPSLAGRSLAQVGRTPSIVVSEAGEDEELDLLLLQLSHELHPSDEEAKEGAGAAVAGEGEGEEEETAHEFFARLSPAEAASALRQHRVLGLLGARSLHSPSSLLLQLARKPPSPRAPRAGRADSSKLSSGRASPANGPFSWAGGKYDSAMMQMRASDTVLDRVRSASSDAGRKGSNCLFDDGEFSDYIANYTRDAHLERIESPVGRNRRHVSIAGRRVSSRPLSAARSRSGTASPITFAAAAELNRESAVRQELLRRSLAPDASPAAAGDDEESVDSIVLRHVPKGVADPGVRALLRAFAPSAEDRPAPALLDWSFNIFEAEGVLGSALLPFLVISYVRTLPLLSELSIDPLRFARYIRLIGSSYRPLPYHSVTHGADAFHAVVHLLESGLCAHRPPAAQRSGSGGSGGSESAEQSGPESDGEGPHAGAPSGTPRAGSRRSSHASRASDQPRGFDAWGLSPAELLGLLVGTAAHDVDHTGQNNAFHVAVGSELAITYNDVSVLENHHCAFAFRALAAAEVNFASSLSPVEYKEMRETMIAVILGTDMAKHFDHVAHLLAAVEGGAPLDLEGSVADRRFLMQTVAHAADISNSCRQTAVAVEWSERVTEEFFAQGDEERARAMPITKFFDRENAQLAKSQLGFFDFIVKPLFEPLSRLLDCAHLLGQLEANREYWLARLDEDEQQPQPEQRGAHEVVVVLSPHARRAVGSSPIGADETPTAARAPADGAAVAEIGAGAAEEGEGEGDEETPAFAQLASSEAAAADGGAPRLTASALAEAVGFKPARLLRRRSTHEQDEHEPREREQRAREQAAQQQQQQQQQNQQPHGQRGEEKKEEEEGRTAEDVVHSEAREQGECSLPQLQARTDSHSSRAKRLSVASIPEAETVGQFDDDAELLCAEKAEERSPSARPVGSPGASRLRTEPAHWPAEPGTSIDASLGAFARAVAHESAEDGGSAAGARARPMESSEEEGEGEEPQEGVPAHVHHGENGALPQHEGGDPANAATDDGAL